MKFTVTIESSGHSFSVAPGEKILKAGLSAGLGMPYSCRMGTCETCRAKVLSGSVDHGDAHPNYLTEEDRAQGFTLLCQATALSDLTVDLKETPALAPPVRFPAMVRGIKKPKSDVAIVDLRLALHQNFKFAAGQYIDILLPDGARRSYSIATPPATPEGVIDLQLHIRHSKGGLFTDALFSEGGLGERKKLDCEGPLGTFFLDDSDAPVVFVARGVGYAPIRSMILDVFRRKITRPMTLYWGARTKQGLYSLDEPLNWEKEYPFFKFVPVVAEPSPEDAWSGRSGQVYDAVAQDISDLSKFQVYACGSVAFIDSTREVLKQSGLQDSRFHADSFVTQAERHASTALAE